LRCAQRRRRVSACSKERRRRTTTHNLERRLLGRDGLCAPRLCALPRGADALDDLVPDGRDEHLLLVRVGAHGDGGEEAPHGLVVEVALGPERVEALVLGDAEGERRGEARRGEQGAELLLQDAEQVREGAVPLLELGGLGRARAWRRCCCRARRRLLLLLERLGAREEDREEGEARLGAQDARQVVAVHEEAEHARHHAQLSLADDGHDGRDDRVEEGLGLGLDGGAARTTLG